MKNIAIIVLFFLLFLSSCFLDEDQPDPPDNGDKLLTEATIDATGGKLEADQFELTVPAGAFNGSVTLKLYKNDSDKPFEGDQLTTLYIIEGLPELILQPLKIAFNTSLAQNADYFIARGEENFISSLDTTTTSYCLFKAIADNTLFSCEIPAMEAMNKKSASANNSFKLKFTLLGNYQYFGEGTHFLIYTPPSLFLQAEELHGVLEYAWMIFDNAPSPAFTYENKRKWPVSVTIKNLNSNVYGYYSNSKWGNDDGYIEFNRMHMNDANQMAITAGHEFLHLVQSLYDPRSNFARASFEPEWHWLNEACAVWIEAEFSEENWEDYASDIRQGNQMAPLEGAVKGAQTSAGLHGYGMSSVIKYIDKEFYENKIPLNLIYDKILEGQKSVPALGVLYDLIPSASIWFLYPYFLENYVSGQIYNDVNPAFWIGNATDNFPINNKDDTLKNFSYEYPQLSGRLFNITLNYPELAPTAYLECSIIPDQVTAVAAFKYKGSAIEQIGSNFISVEVNSLKQIMQDGWNLLVLVSDRSAVDPYLSSRTINLKVKVKQQESILPPDVDFAFAFQGYFKWSNSDSVEYYSDGCWSENIINNGYYYTEAEQYVASWDFTSENIAYKGSLEAYIDFEQKQLTEIYLSSVINTGKKWDTLFFLVNTVPAIDWDLDKKYFRFKIEGYDILNHINHIYYRREAYGNTQNLLMYDCMESCYFSLTLGDPY
jgi:hypothetical protein